ncbi:MAG: hypothetical protein GX219_06210 [Tissierellia bacterium]|nr:hypothetical protein [Tissierellia bacterium]
MRLDEYTGFNNIPNYNAAISPGRHCPLFGVASILRHIEGSTIIYLGTQDCVYYAQKQNLERQIVHGNSSNITRSLAVQVSESDLVFGMGPQVEKLLREEIKKEDNQAIFLVTSCSIELISENLQGIVDKLLKETEKFIGLIPIENFKTFSYLEGIEKALDFLIQYTGKFKSEKKTYAILGARKKGAEDSEPSKYLKKLGYRLIGILPYNINLEELKELSKAEINLVLEPCGLSAAESLHQKYGIPYVRFDRFLCLKATIEAWEKLGNLTNKDTDRFIVEETKKIEELSEEVRKKLEGKSFFYSEKVLYPFETCLFLSKLGMEATCIFVGSSMDRTDEIRQELLKYSNPRIWKNAEKRSREKMLEEERPDYFIGNNSEKLEEYGTVGVQFPIEAGKVGFEYYKDSLKLLLEANKEFKNEGI